MVTTAWLARRRATLLHLGPGLGNGLANLHNARKARSGIVNIVGDHATDHVRHESPLKSEAEAIARSMSHWVRSSASAADVGADGAAAVQAARDGAEGRIATLLLPADTAWGAGGRAAVARPPQAPAVHLGAVPAAARLLRQLGPKAVLLLGTGGSRSLAAQQHAAAIAAHTGCRVLAEFYNARMPGGRGTPGIQRLPYAVDATVAKLADAEALVLAGSTEPIGFFAYPGKPSQLKPAGALLLELAAPQHDVPAALAALAAELGAPPVAAPQHRPPSRPGPSGTLTAESVAAVVGAVLPELTVVVDEAVSNGRGFGAVMVDAAPHDWLQTMGGAIGFGLPGGVGAALGAPGRPVLVLEGDGSAMYTVQALWTMARESLPVVVLVFANRAYRILQGELQGVGAQISGQKAEAMLSLGNPALGLGGPGPRPRRAGRAGRQHRCAGQGPA